MAVRLVKGWYPRDSTNLQGQVKMLTGIVLGVIATTLYVSGYFQYVRWNRCGVWDWAMFLFSPLTIPALIFFLGLYMMLVYNGQDRWMWVRSLWGQLLDEWVDKLTDMQGDKK